MDTMVTAQMIRNIQEKDEEIMSSPTSWWLIDRKISRLVGSL